MKVGYARVSSIDNSQQTGLETQIEILKRHGVERIFSESQSGTSTDKRLQLKECLEFMREGDEFTFTRVDRVCRNSLDLQLLVKDLCDRGITLTATEQPISTKDAISPNHAIKVFQQKYPKAEDIYVIQELFKKRN